MKQTRQQSDCRRAGLYNRCSQRDVRLLRERECQARWILDLRFRLARGSRFAIGCVVAHRASCRRRRATRRRGPDFPGDRSSVTAPEALTHAARGFDRSSVCRKRTDCDNPPCAITGSTRLRRNSRGRPDAFGHLSRGVVQRRAQPRAHVGACGTRAGCRRGVFRRSLAEPRRRIRPERESCRCRNQNQFSHQISPCSGCRSLSGSKSSYLTACYYFGTSPSCLARPNWLGSSIACRTRCDRLSGAGGEAPP